MTWFWTAAGLTVLAALGGGVFLAVQRPAWVAGLAKIVFAAIWRRLKPLVLAAIFASPETIARAKQEAREGLEPGALKDAPPHPTETRPASKERPRGGGR